MSKLTFHPSASALCRGKVFDRIYVILKKILQEAALVILHFSQSLARTSDGSLSRSECRDRQLK